MSKRVVVQRFSCHFVVPMAATSGGLSGGVAVGAAAEGIVVEVELDTDPYTVHFGGSADALRAFGEYLVALSSFGNGDPDHHDHFDAAQLIVHAPRADGHLTTHAEESVDVEITYLDDSRTGISDASGLASPAYEQELTVGVYVDEGKPQVHLGGSRRALRALGGYFWALAAIRVAGYYDTLYGPAVFGAARPCRVVLHAPNP